MRKAIFTLLLLFATLFSYAQGWDTCIKDADDGYSYRLIRYGLWQDGQMATQEEPTHIEILEFHPQNTTLTWQGNDLGDLRYKYRISGYKLYLTDIDGTGHDNIITLARTFEQKGEQCILTIDKNFTYRIFFLKNIKID